MNSTEQQVVDRFNRGDFAGALEAAQQILALSPGDTLQQGNVALCQMRLGRLDEARQGFLAASQAAPHDANLLDGLTEVCGRLGLIDEAVMHGRSALACKAAQVADRPAWPLPAAKPPPFDAAQRQHNVIAFSLFGAQSRYCETVVLNAQVAKRLLPGWRCRVYFDTTVPTFVLQRLAAEGVQLMQMRPEMAQQISGLMWRFLVLDDPSVHRFLLRDADSLISTREASAVQAWIDSERWFHLMRDSGTHTELLLAGLWGGCGGVFQGVSDSLRAHMRLPRTLDHRVTDQLWLRTHAWPTVRQSVLQHDGVFGFMDAQPFPPHEPTGLGPGFHVGRNIAAAELSSPLKVPDGTRVRWMLHDEKGQPFCAYIAVVQGGVWRAAMPQPYMEALRSGRWRCEVQPAPAGA